jgi:hypothetical protein
LTEDLLSSVDQPLAVKRCRQSGRDYLLCDYNRDGDSYRSPWSNEFDPPLHDTPASNAADQSAAGMPSEKVRRMEIKANEAFDVYRELYYEGGVSSVYFWNLDDGFAGVVLLKKCELRSFFFLDMIGWATTKLSWKKKGRLLDIHAEDLSGSIQARFSHAWEHAFGLARIS